MIKKRTPVYNVAVVGATGAVGETMLAILNERNFPCGTVFALASANSVGKRASFGEENLIVEDLADFDFSQADLAFFSAGGDISKEYAPKAAKAGCVVIDNTSAFRLEENIPLVVTEVNPKDISKFENEGIIANPNCSTIQMLVAVKPIYDISVVNRINVCTYQAVSGTGKLAIEELAKQTSDILNLKEVSTKVYPKQIAFNCIPEIDMFMSNGYTKEEMKMVWETKKIMCDERISVNATAVRVPVFYGHSEAVHLETEKKIEIEAALDALEKAPGVKLLNGSDNQDYPTAVTEGANSDLVFVGRVREDISHASGLDMWVVSDNVRKGAALNSIQIAEILIKNYL